VTPSGSSFLKKLSSEGDRSATLSQGLQYSLCIIKAVFNNSVCKKELVYFIIAPSKVLRFLHSSSPMPAVGIQSSPNSAVKAIVFGELPAIHTGIFLSGLG